MRVVFMGTPQFAVPCLESMQTNPNAEIVGVYTQPDRVNRRGKKMRFSPVKEYALAHDLPLYQPATLRDADAQKELQELAPELLIVVAYGQILPAKVLKIPRLGAINVHASLLPKYRGAAPIQYSLLNGDETTGVTVMHLDEGMDTGDIILQRSIDIPIDWEFNQLSAHLSTLGAEALQEVLADADTVIGAATPQEHNRATYTGKIAKEWGRIHWSKNARTIHNLVRALHANPGTYTFFREKRLKIHQTVLTKAHATLLPGELLVDGTDIFVGTGEGSLQLLQVQPESKRNMQAAEFINGYQIKSGEVLGEQTD
ncbi:MAG: methionyl-tRNA formyltransferase [Negativicoccus succinicivorans]|uniref:methionyl-tRNA formyltransferase n=1 Tax=Negativicoccus succinicivorans TaxID=620903 RepID=UPI0029078370|nr:methionyl-tRNA formyltransferase [Negativicoccus succinicivorans]MDU5396329.1 methionyl-tRNA formyltransferase [Negativicoccus succinicivorans]